MWFSLTKTSTTEVLGCPPTCQLVSTGMLGICTGMQDTVNHLDQYVDALAPGCRVSTQGCQIQSTAVDTHVQSPTKGCRVPAQGCWVPTNSSKPTSGSFHHPRVTSTPKWYDSMYYNFRNVLISMKCKDTDSPLI